MVEQRLDNYKKELENELVNILNYWINNTQDIVEGGFYGKIDNYNNVVPGSPKGSVLNLSLIHI